MAAATEPNPPPFTFVLEYMGSAMVIKTVRPASYSILRLCNIAALVLQQKDSLSSTISNPKLFSRGPVGQSMLTQTRCCIRYYNERIVVHEEGKTVAEHPQADTKVQRSKRKYRCRVCKTDGHGKRTCKLVQPTALGGHKQISFEDIDPPLPEHPVPWLWLSRADYISYDVVVMNIKILITGVCFTTFATSGLCLKHCPML
ncbi:hypothetical protein WN943_010492 [Citrus x changshan-huyou]